MPDGIRLAARLWQPEGAGEVPAIFEYVPYRKADMVRARDERNHPYFAAHGFACLRVDMRGSGDSEGHMPDMYDDNELADARHVIEWIAAQPWCDGNVGMFGTSWGGTASLQANIDAPEALKAIIAVCATHDRYEDDIHHMGGCLITDTFEWGVTLPAILASPPTPNVGPDWKDKWQERLENLAYPVEAWVREEARGEYWRHGSVIHQADRLTRPTLAMGGWSDRYSNSVMSLVSARPDLVWGVVGPWGHHYPDHGHPGPAMGFQQLALEWWDHWLRPRQQPLDWPRLRVWERAFDVPADAIDQREGRWIATDAPTDVTEPMVLHLTENGLSDSAIEPLAAAVPSALEVGQAAGDTGYFGRFGGLPLEQSPDDARSLCFETPPLTQDMVLYGAAAITIDVSTSHRLGQVALRLNDVAVDGAAARVAFCIRNLALDDRLDAPEPQTDAQSVSCHIPFHTTAYRFRKGHRIRLSISASYWPIVWPSPKDAHIKLTGGTLVLPVLQDGPSAMPDPMPQALDLPATKNHQTISNPSLERFHKADDDGMLISGWSQPFTEALCTQTGTAFGYETDAIHTIFPDDPTSAKTQFEHRARYSRPDDVADIKSKLTATCDANFIHIEGQLTATWEGESLSKKVWQILVPRRYG